MGDFNGDGITDFAYSNAVIDEAALSQSNFGILQGFGYPDSNNTDFSQVAAGFFKTGRASQQDLVFQEMRTLFHTRTRRTTPGRTLPRCLRSRERLRRCIPPPSC